MRHLILVVLVSMGLSISGNVEHCAGQEPDAGPRLKFWDDLFGSRNHSSENETCRERIETERHDFTQSTKTVGRGVAQIEAGYSYFYKDEDDEIENSHTTPEMLLRLGLTEDIEFRLRWNYAWRFIDDGESLDSGEDMRLSLKLGMTDQECCLPESALEIRATAPTGGGDWSTSRVEFGLDYIYGWKIAEKVELYGSTGFATDGLGDFSLLPDEPAADWFMMWSQSVALGIELTERLTFYSEYFGLFSNALADDFSINIYNIGVDFYVNDDFVLDFRAGVGLSPDSDDFFTGIGGGYRF